MTTLAELRSQAEERLGAFRLNVDDVADADVRFIGAFLNFLDEQEAQDAIDTQVLHELSARRAHAALADWDNRHKAAAAVTTQQDIQTINKMCKDRGPFIQNLVGTRTSVWEDFRVGGRCAVCAMTPAEAAAADYDCTREC